MGTNEGNFQISMKSCPYCRHESPQRLTGKKPQVQIKSVKAASEDDSSSETAAEIVPLKKGYKLSDGGVLPLIVTLNGSKWWHFRYRFNGKENKISLGVYPEVTGPASLTFGDATAVVAAAFGQSLRYRAITDEEARERYSKVSVSPQETEAHVALWRAIREGRLAAVTHEVNRILGRRPITLEQWAAQNAASFFS
jgi:hypothetical protein